MIALCVATWLRGIVVLMPLFVFSFFMFVVCVFDSVAADTSSSSSKKAETVIPLSKSIGDKFDGESFGYKVGFWYFTNAAIANVSIRKREDGRYLAELSAKTTGVLRFVPKLRRREDKYTAVLEETGNGKRFRTVSFEETTTIGKSVRKRTTVFDYKNFTMKTTAEKDGKIRSSFDLPFDKNEYLDDPLCAFYNMRYGVYGEVGQGRSFEVKTFPRKVDESGALIPIRFGTKGEKGSIGEASDDFYYAFVKLDKELFSSKSGEVEILFDKNVLPKKAIAKDVMLFGDVYGELVNGN